MGSRVAIPFQSFAMRLQQPDDELSGMLLLAMPQQVVHRIDPWSPLMPSGAGKAEPGQNPRWNSSTRYTYPGVLQRQVDLETGNREARDQNSSITELLEVEAPSIDAVRAHMESNRCELLILVEGIDAVTRYVLSSSPSSTSACVSPIPCTSHAHLDKSRAHHTHTHTRARARALSVTQSRHGIRTLSTTLRLATVSSHHACRSLLRAAALSIFMSSTPSPPLFRTQTCTCSLTHKSKSEYRLPV
jgi:hypothetical protein